MDAFAGGFVITVFIVYWFSTELGASRETMSMVFFVAGLLQAGSSVVAPRLATRIGLLNTMVFTHLPSNILLMLIPLAPNLGDGDRGPVAAVRAVADGRAHPAGLHRRDGRSAGAHGGGGGDQQRPIRRAPVRPARSAPLLMNNVAIGAPWVAAGALKSIYDVALWRVFSSVPLPDATD